MLYDKKWEKSVEVQLESWQKDLLLAADFLERNLWCQKVGHMTLPNGEKAYCLLGAMYNCVEKNPNRYDAMKQKVQNLLKAKGSQFSRMPHWWNDEEGRTKEEVVALMREAASV